MGKAEGFADWEGKRIWRAEEVRLSHAKIGVEGGERAMRGWGMEGEEGGWRRGRER